MNRRRLCSVPRIRIYLAIATVLGPALLAGQATTWEGLSAAGNRALAQGLLPQATGYFRSALALSAGFPEEDLRRTTALRNLAHSVTLAGGYAEADVLYRQALARAGRFLPADHPYHKTLLNEQAALVEAMRRSAELDRDTVAVSTAFWDRVRALGVRIGNVTTFQTGPVIPIGATVSQSHKAALLHILTFNYRISGSSAFGLILSLDRIAAYLPAERSRFSPPLTVLGLGSSIGLSAGKLALQVGGGLFRISTTTGHENRFGLSAGLGLVVWDGTARGTQPGFILSARTSLLQLPVAPGDPGGAILLAAGLSAGFRW